MKGIAWLAWDVARLLVGICAAAAIVIAELALAPRYFIKIRL